MKALRKISGKIVWTVAVAGIMVLQCANPVNEPPLKWRSKVEIPVTTDKFYVADEMRNLFSQIKTEKIDILKSGTDPVKFGYDYAKFPDTLFKDTVKGDTAVFSVLRIDSISYETHEDSMKSKLFHPTLGPITIANVAPISSVLPLPQNPAVSQQLANVPLPNIYQAQFDQTSPDLQVTVKNGSTTATAITCTLAIFGTVRPLGVLNQNDSATVAFPVSGQSVTGVLPVLARWSAAAVAGKQLTIRFSVNGLIVNYARIDRRLITFKKLFINDYKLTDTVNLQHIDIADGFFNYDISNHTDLDLKIKAEHQHLWFSSYCVQADLQTIPSLANTGKTDSAIYYDGLLAHTTSDSSGATIVFRKQSLSFIKKTLAKHRLFPQWDSNYTPAAGGNPAKGATVSRVVYEVTPSPFTMGSDTVTVSAADSIVFTISAPFFKFERFLGTVMEAYQREGDTETVAVPFPWNKQSKDSLRNNFILKNVFGDIFLKPRLPVPLDTFRPFIDTLVVNYSASSMMDTSVTSTATAKFTHVINDSLFRKQTDLTDIVNNWPDSMKLKVSIAVPAGTRLRAVNDMLVTDPDYNKYIGRMMIKAITLVRMNAVLHWEVRDTAHLDMGAGKFKVPQALRYFNKMENRTITFNMGARNNTNVFMNIYALVAPEDRIRELIGLSVDSTWKMIRDTALARQNGYINFLGSRGIKIPPRGGADSSAVVLNDWQIGRMLDSDTCAWRWQAHFMPQAADALHDTDFIFIKSWMGMEGTNNMDSLLIWNSDTTRL